MNGMPVLAGALLVSISSLLSTLCLHSAAAEATYPSFNQSLERVKEFHDRFKDPTFASRGCGGLSSSRLANDAIAFGRSASRANLLGIDVGSITVIAINMAKGGNAVATSDINLNPVQYLVSSSESEVDCKLK